MENPKNHITGGEGGGRKAVQKRSLIKKSSSEEMNSKKVIDFRLYIPLSKKGRRVSYIKYAIATLPLKGKGRKE